MPPTPKSLVAALARWFRRHQRDLPWRRTRDPYAIWVSETMLQQTQVGTVIPYYERFMARFPTVHALAAAPLDDVLSHWAGLGYYARGRNLHAAAERVVREFKGELPDSVAALMTLPGVGRYTAGAVASIAFGRAAAVVDGNVARVLARLFGIDDDLKAPDVVRRMWALAEALVPARDPGLHNQAMMELGATICTPRGPRCTECPVRESCFAKSNGVVNQIPCVAVRAEVRRARHVVVAVSAGGRWLLVRRPQRGLWGGLWEFPSAPLGSSESMSACAGELMLKLGLPRIPSSRKPFCKIERRLTHRAITLIGFRGVVRAARKVADGCWRRLDELDDLGLSRAMQDVACALREDAARPVVSRA